VTTTNGSGTYTSTNSQVTNAVGQVTETVKAARVSRKTSVAVLLTPMRSPRSVRRRSRRSSRQPRTQRCQRRPARRDAMPFAKTATSETGAIAAADSANRLHLYEHAGEIAALVASSWRCWSWRCGRRAARLRRGPREELSPVGRATSRTATIRFRSVSTRRRSSREKTPCRPRRCSLRSMSSLSSDQPR